MVIYKIFLAVVSFSLFTSLWGFYSSIKPPKITSKITPSDLGLKYEEVSFTTTDNIKIAGWLIPSFAEATDGKPASTIILLHGYPADKGDILPLMSFLHKKYNLLLFDFRYLGKSEGKYTTAGAKEVEDLLAAIRFLESRGIKEVGVWGFSMGGAVALMTASKAPEIKVIVSESSYASLNLMTTELYRIPILKYPLAYLTGIWTKIILGIDLKKVSPTAGVKDLNIPILLVHSKNDEVIPFLNALLIQEALKDNLRAEFWFQENLVHGQLGNEYQKRIEDFFEKYL